MLSCYTSVVLSHRLAAPNDDLLADHQDCLAESRMSLLDVASA